MDLNALELFAAAAAAGSLSAAARRTEVPLPTLSRRVRQLEDDLGLRLLERGAQGLVLTRAGTQLLAEVGPALATLRQAQQRLREDSAVAGTLRVSMPPHFAPMRSVFALFGERYSDVRFDVFVTDRRVDLIADGIDVAVRVGEGGSSAYVGRTLARYRHRVVASPRLLRGARLERPADLRGRPCACWRTSNAPAWTLGGVELALEPVMVTNDYEHLLLLALEGRVITELPPFMATRPIEAGELVEVLPDHPLPLASLRALVLDTRALSPLIRQFLDFVADELPTALLDRP